MNNMVSLNNESTTGNNKLSAEDSLHEGHSRSVRMLGLKDTVYLGR